MQYFGTENAPTLVMASTTQVTLATTYLGQPTVLLVGGQAYTPASTLTMTTSTAGFNGLDTGAVASGTLYYIYAVVQSGVLGLIISLTGPATGPTGFTSAYKYLGKLRTNVGAATIAAVATSLSIRPEKTADEEWQSYTPTGAWTGSVTYTGRWRRISGDSMQILAKVTASAAPTPSNTELNFTIPTGYTIDSTKVITLSGNEDVVGSGAVYKSSVRVYPAIAHVQTSTAVKIRVQDTAGSSGGGVEHDNPITFANLDTASVNVIVPIAEWKDLYT